MNKKNAAKKFLDTFFADWKNLWVITNVVQNENNLEKSIASIKKCDTSSAAQGGRGSVKNRKPIGKVGCCESQMAEQRHWWIYRCFRSPLFLSLSCHFSDYLPTYQSIYLFCHLFIYLSIFSFFASTHVSIIYLSKYLSIHLSFKLSILLTI